MTPERAPVFSVVIATWNWSAALELALQSVLDQTFTDFEVLVVGDACTDDSAEVVASFGDPRLRWHNLEANFGNQWGPNNHALSVARGEYVAYLGHDDLWWPSHLATAKAAFDRSGADMVASATLMYGPPGSGIRAVSGFFPNDTYSDRHFFPPSSMLHRLELGRRVGGWRSPDQAEVAVDRDFMRRCSAAGASVVATGEFTTFKFNTAWRRDCYLSREVDEQRRFLANMRERGDAFRVTELSGALRAASEYRLPTVELSPKLRTPAAGITASIQKFKGSRFTPSNLVPELIGPARRYPMAGEHFAYEWYPVERHPQVGLLRWTGPCRDASLLLPERIEQATRITVSIVTGVSAAVVASARLLVNGTAIHSEVLSADDGTHLLCGTVRPGQIPERTGGELLVTISVAQTWRPVDLGLSETDTRWLGIAVRHIEFEKIPD